ncbi:MAG: MFS transporter [Flavobacteriales bacterium]
MFQKAFTYYFDSFRGFKREIWVLTLASLINRAGTMVIPFLSLYLTSDVGLSLTQVGWVMTAFGAGSFMGSWLGGKLSDTIGAYRTMVSSLIISGFLFMVLQYVRSFEAFCVAIAILMVVADTFRPALFVAIKQYSKPENRTRSVGLIRLAINLGFSLGPAAGGFVIAHLGYGSLFWIDGLSCLLAGSVILLLFNQKSSTTTEQTETVLTDPERSPYSDRLYLLFLVVIVLFATTFLQYFSSVPLYYRDVHHLSERSIGLLFALNGLLVFFFELLVIKRLEQAKWSVLKVIFLGNLLLASSFFMMNLTGWSGILVIGMITMTFAEMMIFPFANRFCMDRADGGKTGAYMAAYTVAFSLGHIIGHNAGLQLVGSAGFEVTWYLTTAVSLIGAGIILVLRKMKGHQPNS